MLNVIKKTVNSYNLKIKKNKLLFVMHNLKKLTKSCGQLRIFLNILNNFRPKKKIIHNLNNKLSFTHLNSFINFIPCHRFRFKKTGYLLS